MLSSDVLATLHPSLLKRARMLAFSDDEAEEMLADAFEELVKREARVPLPDHSQRFLAFWLRRKLVDLRRDRARRRAATITPEDLALIGVMV